MATSNAAAGDRQARRVRLARGRPAGEISVSSPPHRRSLPRERRSRDRTGDDGDRARRLCPWRQLVRGTLAAHVRHRRQDVGSGARRQRLVNRVSIALHVDDTRPVARSRRAVRAVLAPGVHGRRARCRSAAPARPCACSAATSRSPQRPTAGLVALADRCVHRSHALVDRMGRRCVGALRLSRVGVRRRRGGAGDPVDALRADPRTGLRAELRARAAPTVSCGCASTSRGTTIPASPGVGPRGGRARRCKVVAGEPYTWPVGAPPPGRELRRPRPLRLGARRQPRTPRRPGAAAARRSHGRR